MSPLIIVGITLLTTALGDVSHVLQGQTHPPTDPREASNPFETKSAQDFWWMQDDSPFKSSVKNFKKCSTGKCATGKTEYKFTSSGASGAFAPIDIQKNVFLNGGVSQQASSASFSSSSSTSFHNGVNVDLRENPFLKGSFSTAESSPHSEKRQSKSDIDLSSNPFLNGQPIASPTFSQKRYGKADTDLSRNPFLNGQLNVSSSSSETRHSKADVDLSSNSFSNGRLNETSIFPGSSSGSQSVEVGNTKIDLSNNPFFKEHSVHRESSAPILPGGKLRDQFARTDNIKIDLSNNPFFKEHTVHNANGDKIRDENGFIGVQPSVPFKKTGYHSSVDVSGQQGATSSSSCTGSNHACVPRADCVNGLIASEKILIDIENKATTCTESEVCCQLPGSQYVNKILVSGKSSVPGSETKVTDVNGLTVDQVHVISASQEGIRPQLNFIGGSGSSTIKPIRDLTASASETFFSSTPDYSDVHFGNEARFSDLDGVDYLPPHTDKPKPSTYRPTPPSCPPGQFLSSSGSCESIHKECPPGTRATPSGGCEKLKVICAPGQRLGPYGQCEPIPTQPPTCGPGQKLGPYGQCEPIPTQPPSCGPGQKLGPYGQCEPLPTRPPSCGPGQRLGLYGQCEPIPTQPPTCGPGQRLGPYGKCELIPTQPPTCGPGQRLGPYGQCEPIPTQPPTCGPGQKLGPYGQCIPIPTQPPVITCGPGQKLGPYGQCVQIPTQPPIITCGPGEQRGPYGQCVPIPTQPPIITCGPGEQRGPYGQCVPIPTQPPIITCGPGEQRGPHGYCVPIPTQPPVITCGPGQKLGPYGQCVPIPTQPSIITCGIGQQQGPNGKCVPIPTQPPRRVTCGPNQTVGPAGNCITVTYLPPASCRAGQRTGPNGECIDVTVPPIRTTPSPPPRVVCGFGERLGPYGQCESVPTPRPSCPPGYFPTASGGCQRPRPPPPACPPGTVKSPSGRCETSKPPPDQTCPSGSFLDSSGKCVRPTPPTTTRTYLPPETDRTTHGYHYPTPPTTSFTDGHNEEPDFRPTDKIPSSGNNIPIHVRPPGYNETVPIEQIPVGCAAALKCVQEIYCTAEGFVSPVPVVLTKQQELLRAPTTTCRIPESGSVGKCCRDAEYKDAWPSANLVNGVDDGQYAEDDSIGQYKADYQRFSRSSNSRRARRINRTKRQTEENCGVRNLNSSPPGVAPIDADFAEISWQAMILRDSNRSLLCGGVIIRRNAVLTSAACVEGLETSDILIKGGEWKLGIDEEPLPFQIVKVAAIARHPDFKAGSLLSNLAILVLEENLRFTKNIGKLCLPAPNLIPTQNCIATGWGKRILQLHAKGALMHRINIDVMDVQQCQQVLNEHFPQALSNYNTNTLCGFSNIDQCRVDYGSALACADETGRYTLSGIYSWDTGCKQKGQIGAYVAPDVDWIENVLDTPLKQLKRQDKAYNNARIQALA